MISENEEEALFILLFWKVGPSYDNKTLRKCVYVDNDIGGRYN